MTSDYSATIYQAPASHLPSRSAIAGSCWGKNMAAGAALCMAFFASPAMAQEPSTYQGYLDECLGNAKSAQESMRRGIEKATAEGNTGRVDMLTQRLEANLANSAQKCETYSRDMAEKDSKIAAADAIIAKNKEETAKNREETAKNREETAKNREETAKNQAISAAARKETAELRKINEVFKKVNAELPQLIRDMEAVLAGKITGGQRDAVIRKLEAYVVTGHDLIKRARAIPGFLTPENIEIIAGFEKSVLRVESSLRGTTR